MPSPEPLMAVLQDLRFAARALRRQPGFTLVAVMSLAACWVPARRALRVDPMDALRGD